MLQIPDKEFEKILGYVVKENKKKYGITTIALEPATVGFLLNL